MYSVASLVTLERTPWTPPRCAALSSPPSPIHRHTAHSMPCAQRTDVRPSMHTLKQRPPSSRLCRACQLSRGKHHAPHIDDVRSDGGRGMFTSVRASMRICIYSSSLPSSSSSPRPSSSGSPFALPPLEPPAL